MSSGTAIEWTDATWNPTTGCRKVSPGCDNCYAATLARRLKAMRNPRYQNDGPDGAGFGLTLHWDKIDQPKSWLKPRRIFVNSMSDLFHPEVPSAFLDQAFGVMAECSQHQFQILTKRPTRMLREMRRIIGNLGFTPGNIWLGTSVENQEWAAKRIPALLETPAAIRFLSCEPLLGPVSLSEYLHGIDWVIVGGESGPGHRPIMPEWVHDIKGECELAQVPFFFKQWGGRTPKARGRELDGRTWDQMPGPEIRFSSPSAEVG